MRGDGVRGGVGVEDPARRRAQGVRGVAPELRDPRGHVASGALALGGGVDRPVRRGGAARGEGGAIAPDQGRTPGQGPDQVVRRPGEGSHGRREDLPRGGAVRAVQAGRRSRAPQGVSSREEAPREGSRSGAEAEEEGGPRGKEEGARRSQEEERRGEGQEGGSQAEEGTRREEAGRLVHGILRQEDDGDEPKGQGCCGGRQGPPGAFSQ
mmetsp:Transcript_19964/g.64306  ORF Transcript_19964/g.64306 Transcript_19964/m.64306 type:complete len:210 (+) Transcript_19964:427-1056(+)